MDLQEIHRRIPHRQPMLLVDAILEESDASIVCKKLFRREEYFFQGHFPDSPIVPGVIQCECCLQAGALLLAGLSESKSQSGDDGSLPVATRMDSVKFKRMVQPGDEVTIHVTLKEQISTASYLTGKLMLNGKLVMRLDFSVTLGSGPQGSESQRSSGSKNHRTGNLQGDFRGGPA